jgi:hypothetical protein
MHLLVISVATYLCHQLATVTLTVRMTSRVTKRRVSATVGQHSRALSAASVCLTTTTTPSVKVSLAFLVCMLSHSVIILLIYGSLQFEISSSFTSLYLSQNATATPQERRRSPATHWEVVERLLEVSCVSARKG